MVAVIPPLGVVRVQELVEGFVELAATETWRGRRGAIIDRVDDDNPIQLLAQSIDDVVQSLRPVPGGVLSPRGRYRRQLPPIATEEAHLGNPHILVEFVRVVLPNPGPLEQQRGRGGSSRFRRRQ